MSKQRRLPLGAALKLAAVALLVLLAGLVPYPRAFTSALRRAEAHRAAGEYGAALDAYHQAAGLDGTSPLPWQRSGEVLLVQHRFPEATEAFQRAAALGGDLPALLDLGESYAGRGDWANALRVWYRALAVAPDDARIHLALARGSVAQAQFARAEDELTRALELKPEPAVAAQAHALLGRLLAGDDAAAAAGYARSLDDLHQASDLEMAAVLESAAKETDPLRRELLLGAAFLRNDELSLAHRHFQRATDLDPDSAEALAYLGHTLDRLGETVRAREVLEQALALDPEAPLVYYFLGIHNRQVGNLADAQAMLWQGLLRDPDNAGLRAEMARAFEALSDYAAAAEWYRGAVDAASEDPGFALLLAQFYVDHVYRIEEEGVPAAQAAVDLAPSEASAYDLLGWAYCLAGQPAEGEQALLQALALDPQLASAHFHLGSLYVRTGRADLARQHLQRAADADTTGYYRQRAQLLTAELP